MTQHPHPPEPPVGAPQTTPTPEIVHPRKNRVGLVALIAAILGFVFACIPGALIVGWMLLPVGFILGIVALTRKDQKKGTGLAAIILSVVGTIVGVIVFVAVAAGAVSDAFDEGGTTVVTEDERSDAANDSTEGDAGAADEPEQPAAGTRDHPYAFTDVVQNDSWTIALTGFSANANEEIAQANPFNEEAGDGSQWVVLEATATYEGADTGNTLELSINYVTADGTVVGAYDAMASGLDPEFDGFAELYAGGSEDGKIAFLVPDSLDGLIRVTPGILANDVFFALPAQ